MNDFGARSLDPFHMVIVTTANGSRLFGRAVIREIHEEHCVQGRLDMKWRGEEILPWCTTPTETMLYCTSTEVNFYLFTE